MRRRRVAFGLAVLLLSACGERTAPPSNATQSAVTPATADRVENTVADNGAQPTRNAALPAPLATAAPMKTADDASCSGEIGKEAAAELVRQCIFVSPATHPPCNAANACTMIRDEIKRGCNFIGDGKPGFCPA